MKAITIIACYWIVSVIIIYIIRWFNDRKHSERNIFADKQSMLRKIADHLVIIFLMPIFLPFVLIYLLVSYVYKTYDKHHYRNRPRPVSKQKRNILKKDTVLDETNTTVSLAEYNYKHGTSFTLDQVYGRGYESSLSDEEKKSIKEHSSEFGILRLDENLMESAHTDASICLGNAMLSGDFTAFDVVLEDNASVVLHGNKTISGKDKVSEYWKGWRERYVVTKKTTEFKVLHSHYYSNSCLQMGNMIVLFMFTGSRVSRMVLVRRHISGGYYAHHDDLVDCYPFSYNFMKRYIKPLREADELHEPVIKENRMPCFKCGQPSESLEWYNTDIKAGIHGYIGQVSICPKCGKIVEYYTEARYRMETPVPDEYDMLDEYAASWNNREVGSLIDYLSDDFHYSSFWVFEELDLNGYIEYFSGKLHTLEETGSDVKAKVVGKLLVVTQNGNNVVIEVKFKDGKIASAYMSPASFYGLPDRDEPAKMKSCSNIYSENGNEYHNLLKSNVEKVDEKDKKEILFGLTSLGFDEGWHLGLKLADEQTSDIGDESEFYIYDDNDNRERDILKHLHAQPDAMSAWQVYMLMTSPTVMPVFWHGGYITRRFIFKETDLQEIEPIMNLDMSALSEKGMLLPSVKIEKTQDASNQTAHVYCCYWNEWKGLVREHARIVFRDNRIESYNAEDEYIFYEYDCGICF